VEVFSQSRKRQVSPITTAGKGLKPRGKENQGGGKKIMFTNSRKKKSGIS